LIKKNCGPRDRPDGKRGKGWVPVDAHPSGLREKIRRKKRGQRKESLLLQLKSNKTSDAEHEEPRRQCQRGKKKTLVEGEKVRERSRD